MYIINMAKVLIDSDSCPVRLRSILLRAAERTGIEFVFAADRNLGDVISFVQKNTGDLRKKSGLPKDSPEFRAVVSKVRMEVVPTGANSADDLLASLAESGDLVVTHDIPLASRCILSGALAMDDRGNIYDENNIGERLSLRDAMTDFRAEGINAETTKRLTEGDIRVFSASLDKLLNRIVKSSR